MKTKLFALFAGLALISSVSAVTTSIGVDNLNLGIPDNNLNGVQNTLNVSGFGLPIGHVTVNLNVTGGFNGDLYGYLSHNGAISILFNRVGRSSANGPGYPDGGFGPAGTLKFTFDDQASADVHWYRAGAFSLNGAGQLTGRWQPDGRNIDPLSAGSVFSGATRGNMLSVFNNLDANGPWTLYLADASSGFQSTLQGWGLEITPVPEPAMSLLILVGGVTLFLVKPRNSRARL